MRLAEFRVANEMTGKGALALVLHVTRYARDNGMPLDPTKLVTGGTGQVHGLGKARVQSILFDHGVKQVLAEEGGRTSRGSLGKMQAYVKFLNEFHSSREFDLALIEAWWVERIREFFAAKPFRLKIDPAKSIQAIIGDLLAQAQKRQREASGAMHQGTMLQHLVGAKLELALPELHIQHHGAAVADTVTSRDGDFVLDDSVLHITVSPGEAVIRKCGENINGGLKPIILTLSSGVSVANGLAKNAGLDGRIDIMDAEQFLAANLHELSLFKTSARPQTMKNLVYAYNRIVDQQETDPSLRIELA